MTNDLEGKVVKKNKLYVKWKTTPLTSVNYELNKKSFKDCEKISSEMPSTFFHNGKELTNPTEIANAFITHFVNIGKTLASYIVNNIPDNTDYTQYLNTPSVETCRSKFKCA